jgi:hypothetical protein
MMYLQNFSLAEYVGFAVVLFLLLVLDAVLTNIVARAAGHMYYKVEPLPWVKWIYRKINGFTFSLAIHLMLNFAIMAIVIIMPVKASYVLLFIGVFFMRVWSVAFKAYYYGRGML